MVVDTCPFEEKVFFDVVFKGFLVQEAVLDPVDLPLARFSRRAGDRVNEAGDPFKKAGPALSLSRLR
jgi:hypothetical protein